jgi:hypothetical protein
MSTMRNPTRRSASVALAPAQGGLSVNRLIRFAPVAASLLGATLVFACADGVTAPASPEFARGRPESPGEFTSCRPQPYASGSGLIGPKGGTVKAGRHELVVPPGALSAATWITMESPSDTLNYVIFGPEGLRFRTGHSPQLLMSYKNCSLRPGAKPQVVYVNDSLSAILETPPSAADTLGQAVDAELSHFSKYALHSTYAVAY